MKHLLPTRMLLLAAFSLCCALSVQAQHGGGGSHGGGSGGLSGGGILGSGGRGGSLDRSRSTFGDAGTMPHRDADSRPRPMRSGPQLGPPGRWWDDKHTVKSLSLRPDQQRRMDDIFDTNKSGLLSSYANLQREQGRLGEMSSAELADEIKVFAAIDRVAQARAELEKENAHILLQIRKELDSGQIATLDRSLVTAQ